MKVYTIQTVAFYEELMRNGIAYCTREGYWCRNNRFQYDWMVDQMRMTHQPRTLFDPQIGTLEFFWDANGNLAQIIGCKQNSGRLHEWDEENRLRFVLGEKFTGYYGYNADGERVYKLTGQSILGQVNSGSIKAQAIFDDAVLYPNPYVVVTSKGYTKHYYAGTERIATVIGGGGFGDMVSPTDKLSSPHDQDIVKTFYSYYQNYDPFFYQKIVSQPEKTEDIFGKPSSDLDYQCIPTELVMVDILNPPDILLKSISINEQNNGSEKEVYFYHGDHLGSANWITDYTGAPVQYIHYAPYGELIDNQVPYGYDERYKFTGKERDAETGYDFFGARYLSSILSHWLSVDPLSDKYPNISPYAYCAWNPIRFIDPDGKRVVGHSADDVETFVQDIGYILKDPKFEGYRGLIRQEGNRIGKISRQDYKTWKAGAELSADEECYVDLLTAIINAPQTCTIEYLENDLCAMSIQADAYLSGNSPIFSSVQGILPYYGGAITSGVDRMSAYSVIAKTGESVTNLRAVNSMHEVLGHGYAFIRGFSNDENQVQALRVENLVRRLLELSAYDGSTHPHPDGADLNQLPKIK